MGASTGGFTDCLLQHGAQKVVAIDVGHNQIDWRLRNDPRVEVREGVNARYLQPEDFPHKFDLAVMDVSFISATKVLPAIVPLIVTEVQSSRSSSRSLKLGAEKLVAVESCAIAAKRLRVGRGSEQGCQRSWV